MGIHIGIGKADITPPVGVPLVGFAGRGDSDGVYDRLRATVLAATEGDETFLLVDCDLLGIGVEIGNEIKEEIKTRTGVSGDRVMIACTHTHYGPDANRRATRPDAAAYQEMLKYLIAGAAAEAMANRQDAHVGVGYGTSYIGVNRREKLEDGSIILGHNPGGPTDRTVGVLRIDKGDGSPLATLINFACHPVSQGGKMRTISADYPGKTREVVEQLTGTPCLFLQGACGNINSVIMEHSYEPPRTLGTRLGCEAVKVRETIETAGISGVGRVSKSIDLPRYRYMSLENAEALAANLEKELEELKKQVGDKGKIYWAESRLEKANSAVKSWRTGEADEPVQAEISVMNLGSLAFVTAPGEIFCQIGMEIKNGSPFENTFFTGYSGGSIGYVPVPDAYAEGGYEVTHACRVDPDAAQLITDKSLELLVELQNS